MLERTLAQTPNYLGGLLACLSETRSLGGVAKLFHFEDHPMLEAIRKGSVEGQTRADHMPTLIDIVYHCDLDGGYHSVKKAFLRNKKRKYKDDEIAKKLTKVPGPVGETRVLRNAARDHFKQCCDENSFFSVPQSAEPVLERMDDFLGSCGTESAANARREQGELAPLAIADQDYDIRQFLST